MAGTPGPTRGAKILVLDSGASSSVIPLSWVPPRCRPLVRPSKRIFYAANGQPLQSTGTLCTTCVTTCGQKFSCNVHTLAIPKGLISVSQLAKNGHEVSFTSVGGCVHLRNGQQLVFEERAGVYSIALEGVSFKGTVNVPWEPLPRPAKKP